MKTNKFLKICLITLVIALVSIVSFAGVFIKKQNKYSNIVKEYQLGMDLSGYRRVQLKVSDEKETIKYDANGKEISSSDTETEVASSEEKAINAEEVLNRENYVATRKILEKRLNVMGVQYYETRLDEENGTLTFDIPENDNTDNVVAQLQSQGKFEIVDNETNEVLMTNDDLEYVKAGYGRSGSSTQTVIFLNFQFNKQGTEKFKDITNKYVETKTTDEESGEEKTETKEITMKIDGSTLLTTHFDREIANGLLQLSVGSSSSSTAEELQDNYIKARDMSAILSNGMTPVVYQTSQNEYIASDVTNYNMAYFTILVIVTMLAVTIYFVVKYKEKGILSTIAFVGYIAILLLIIRYTNVLVTISGLTAIILSAVIFCISLIKIMKYNSKLDDKKEAYKRAIVKTTLILIPVFVIAVVFTVATSWQPISSFGMIMFWGVVINLIYNLTVTKTLLLDSKN